MVSGHKPERTTRAPFARVTRQTLTRLEIHDASTDSAAQLASRVLGVHGMRTYLATTRFSDANPRQLGNGCAWQ
jgi:hypothetical protein